LCVARQNGKGVVLQAIELFVAFELGVRAGYDLIIHTAHEFGTCQDHQKRLDAFIQECPHLHAQVKERRVQARERAGVDQSQGRDEHHLQGSDEGWRPRLFG
jgi:hypothetical protein